MAKQRPSKAAKASKVIRAPRQTGIVQAPAQLTTTQASSDASMDETGLSQHKAPPTNYDYDPACGSGGMFVQSEKFAEAHGGNRTDVSIFGQESNPTTWRLAHMNLAIRGIEANLGSAPGDTFLRDAHPDLKAGFVLANPPFNVSDWSGRSTRGDRRWAVTMRPSATPVTATTIANNRGT